MDHIHHERLRWRIHIALRPVRSCGAEWDRQDGVILASPDIGVARQMLDMHIPSVNCLSHFEPMGFPTVRVDDVAIGRLAAEYFLERGFENLIYYASNDRGMAALRRWEGFQQRAKAAKCRCRFLPGGAALPPGAKRADWPALVREVRQAAHPLAIFASFDMLGLDIAHDCFKRGVGIPDQIAVLGVDDDAFLCELCRPPLSSIALPCRQIGIEAARRLAALLAGDGVPAKPFVLPPNGVVARQSTDTLAVESPGLRKALAWLREHACDPCNVADLARHVGMSRRALEIAFSTQLKRSPRQAIQQIRLDRAQRLLRETRQTVEAIGAQCGYPAPQTFCRAFRAATGETPAGYRRRHE
ncbi:MAG: substrate-binding domain-containing protein [Kiritimatiellia bacterium]|jgi:LacI family transcriptional regulator